jgi:GR25 family glycosyltransferase involved in LPS biosynthesis
MKAYVIHLERATGRRGQVEKIRASLPMPLEIVPAVDGAALSAEAFRARYRRTLFQPRYPFELRAGEIGCFLSHRKCWEMIASGDDAGALIIEDDVNIDAALFARMLPFVESRSGEEAYLRFPVKAGRETGKVLFEKDRLSIFAPITPGLGTQGQYVGRAAALALLKATELFDRPIDSFLQMRFQHHVPILSTSPMVMEEISADIGSSLIQGKDKPLSKKIGREILRPIYRWKVASANKKYAG